MKSGEAFQSWPEIGIIVSEWSVLHISSILGHQTNLVVRMKGKLILARIWLQEVGQVTFICVLGQESFRRTAEDLLCSPPAVTSAYKFCKTFDIVSSLCLF